MIARAKRGASERLCVILLAAAAMALVPLACRPPETETAGPKLLLVVVVDQFHGGYLDRFAGLWSGGIARLRDEGVVFADAHHRHALTHTATGYATLATGCHPRRHGVVSNYWYDPVAKRRVYSVGDEEHEVSPANLLVPTLGDRLKERSPAARVFAVSGKDRAAVLLGGRRADAAFWYDTGRWTSSSYYPGGEPRWLDEFHAQQLLDRHFGEAWVPLPVDPEVLAAAGVRAFDLGPLEPDFPLVFGGLAVAPHGRFYETLQASPWFDDYLTRFAERLIVEEGLGADGTTDLLALGHSALDWVGHYFGPDSPQVLDTLLRLDRSLGELFDFVDRRIGLDNVVIALSSDHGVAPLPELGGGGRRMNADDVLCFQRVNARLAERFGEDRWLLQGPFVNPEALTRHGVERQTVEAAAAGLLADCPAVAGVWRRAQLTEAAADAPAPYVNTFHPGRSPDLLVEFIPGFMPTLTATTHGSPHRYDTWVPLIVRAPGVAPRRDEAPAGTVDLAPTLAALAGLPLPGIDGKDLTPRFAPGAEAP